MKVCFIDFEYRPKISRNELVCCVLQLGTQNVLEQYWLYNSPTGKKALIKRIHELKERDFIFCAYAADAECECFIDLGLNPMDYSWLCLRVLSLPWSHSSSEYADFIANKAHFVDISRDFVVDKKGKNKEKSKKYTNLIGALEFFCSIKRDAVEKKEMIKLILEREDYTREESLSILQYCEEDICNLHELLQAIYRKNIEQFGNTDSAHEDYLEKCFEQSFYCACAAIYKRNGLPLDMKLYRFIEEKADYILKEEQINANSHHPFFVEKFSSKSAEKVFQFEREGKVQEAKEIRDKLKVCTCEVVSCYQSFADFIIKNNLEGEWPRSETKKFKKDEETLKNYSNSLPAIKALLRESGTASMLRTITSGNFLTHVDVEKETQHPYFNIFGTLTSRNAPTSTSFLLLHPAWVRVMMRPKPGHVLISADFSSQEIWIAACLSGDENLMDAYLSGDVYLAFGKQAGFIEEDATKESAGLLRNIAKGIVLGLQFGMGPKLLALKTNLNIETAIYYCDLHKKVYRTYYKWKEYHIRNHERAGVSCLADGFLILDNRAARDTKRYRKGEHFSLTTGNSPIQGNGAVIKRRSVQLSLERNLPVITPHHDELITHSKEEDVEKHKKLLVKSMTQAASSVFPNCPKIRVSVSSCRHDQLYVEDKGIESLHSLKKYLHIGYNEETSEFYREY